MRVRYSLGMPVPPPSPRAHNPAIPGSVDEIVRKALAFDPTERFRDAGEIVVWNDVVDADFIDRRRHRGVSPELASPVGEMLERDDLTLPASRLDRVWPGR